MRVYGINIIIDNIIIYDRYCMGSSDRSILLTPLALKAFGAATLHASHSRLLWHILNTVPVSGAVLSNADLARLFKTSTSNISFVLKDLCMQGFIQRGLKVGRSYQYKPNPAFIRILS